MLWVLIGMLTVMLGLAIYEWLRTWMRKALVIHSSDFPVTNTIIKRDALYSFTMEENSLEEITGIVPYKEVLSIIKTIGDNPESFYLDQLDYILIIIRSMEVVKIKLDIEKSRNRSLVVKFNNDSLLSPIKFALL